MKFIEMKKLIALMLLTFAASISAAAQDIAAIRRAVVSNNPGAVIFDIDTNGLRGGEGVLEISRLDNSGSFVGFYYPGTTRPVSTNVTGSITIVRAADGAVTGNAVRISFTVSDRTGTRPGFPGLVNTTIYDGAIWMGLSGNPSFMAGTYTISGAAQTRRAPGPFPFCATLTSIPQ